MSPHAEYRPPEHSAADEMLGELAARPYAAAAIPLGCAALVVAAALLLYGIVDLGTAGLSVLLFGGVVLTWHLLERAVMGAHRPS